ncbi:Similar to short chain oxidoreductase or oxoacyl carrier reductase [Crenothrix polyspora]|uniref:Similar to short chain oxidoreductase or oxoacyl carrier reductase n=1 Tax=Crenothrix polyspora TaxID=360316 RepID=A0A1R4H2G5_9GAMM|nr:SDR family NAD(P)-dependent oxidoreductase [Crenothrix polyspora]SJM90437.1 Similar to short chain oxidoreductase or oxoacyl carrier reductase [Crenothrix polyspora]
MSSLINRVAVVSGASSGIGKAIALGLAQEGARVCLVGRSLEKLHAVVECVPQFSKNMSVYQIDLGVDEDINALAVNIQQAFGGIDILIHSAGVIALGGIDQACIKDFDHQYRVNVRAAYLLTQVFLPTLKLRCGQIVYINSSAGLTARGGVGQYAATKHALKAIADSLREEVNANGVRVLSVYPGRTASPMQEAVYAAENKAYQPEELMQPEDIACVVINALNLPRTAEVTDINIRPMKKRLSAR